MKIHYRLALLVTLLTLAYAAPARAQIFDLGDPEDVPYSRGYISVAGGATVKEPREAVAAVEFGERINDLFEAYLNFTYARDIMLPRMRQHLDNASAAWTQATGTPYSFTGRDQGLTLTYGGRFLFPTGSPVRVYAGAGFGGIWIRRSITEATIGDVTRDFGRVYGETDGNVGVGGSYSLKPQGEAVVGVALGAGRLYADFAVRRRRVFKTEERLDYQHFTASLGVRF